MDAENEEILLFKAQRFTFDVVVGGIENFVDGLRHCLCFACFEILAAAEHIDVEILRCLRVPKSYAVDGVGVVALKCSYRTALRQPRCNRVG